MKDVDPAVIRTLALIGHQGSGKTSLGEAMLFNGGVTPRQGSVDTRSSTFDFEPEEQDRGGSIATTFATLNFSGRRYHVIDTPGDGSFAHEPRAAMAAADSVVLVVSAVDGVEVETERNWNTAVELGLPRVIFINKMDRERANPEKTVKEIKEILNVRPVPLQVPIGKEDQFKGIVDLLRKEAHFFKTDGSGKTDKGPVPADLVAEVDTAYLELVECAAEGDDSLLEKYFEAGELTTEEVFRGVEKGIRSGKLVPMLYGCATGNRGVQRLLEVGSVLPSPLDRPARMTVEGGDVPADPNGPFAALVVKTLIDPYAGTINVLRIMRGTLTPECEVRNATLGHSERVGGLYWLEGKKLKDCQAATVGDVVAVTKLKDTHTGNTLCDKAASVKLEFPAFPPAMSTFIIRPATKSDEGKVREGMRRLTEEDPCLRLGNDELSKELTLSGGNPAHVEMQVVRLKRKYGTEVELSLPPVPYRETIRGTTEIEGKHKKQTGGRGQFAVAWLKIEPNSEKVFEFVDAIVGGSIPRNFIPAVEKGVVDAMDHGPLAGYPVTNVRVTVFDGKYHDVDSSEAAFKMAGSKGFKGGFLKCHPLLLEPIVRMTISVPEVNVGDVMGDITSRRGRVSNTEYGARSVVTASVPLAEVQNYAPVLRAMTQGRGTFTWEHAGFEEVPAQLQEKIIAASTRKVEDEED
ncbi:MAG: elongation factor G [Myxococcota bacterium]